MTKNNLEGKVKEVRLDPDFSSDNPYNKEAAKEPGWTYNPKTQDYRDEDGCIIADKYGQRY